MFSQQPSLKIRPDHLDRLAVIYVRQSTLFQVRENSGRPMRQYDLVKRAQDLGWTPASIQVVDQDQGQSGSSSLGRDGFQWLVAQVGLGHVGAVLSLEVSRLARSCSDWYRLLEICALSETLVIDEEGIHLIFLPPYSPELQPCERLWPLSNEAIANRRFETLDELQEVQAERCVALQNDPTSVCHATLFHWWPISSS